MKKNMLRKDFYMEIRKSLGRFVSIFFIVALGVAFYSGIRASEPSMRISGDRFFDRLGLMDIKVMGTLGLTEEDLTALKNVDGIESVEGGYSKDVLCPAGETEKVVHMISVQENFNTVQIAEGRLPKKEGECFLDEDFLNYADYKVGDMVTFSSGDTDPLSDSLVTDTYKIVGIGSSPLYISLGRGNSLIGNGEVTGYVLVSPKSFNMEVYTEAYVRVEGAAETVAYTGEYEELSDNAVAAIKEIEKQRCEVRRQSIVDEAEEELADAKDEITKEDEKLSDAKKDLETAQTTAASELLKAKEKLASAEKQLAEAKAQIADGETQLAAGKAELISRQNSFIQGKKEYESQLATLNQSEKELEDAQTAYLLAYTQNMPLIQGAKTQIEEGKETIASTLEPLKLLQTQLVSLTNGITQITQTLTEGEELYNQYLAIAEEDRTEEQKVYLQSWPATKTAMEGEKQELEGQLQTLQAALVQQGLTEDSLNESVTNLEEQNQELEEKYQGLVEQENALTATGEQIKGGLAEIADGRGQLATAKTQLDSAESQINAAWSVLNAKESELAAGKSEIVSGEQELAEGQSQYEAESQNVAEQLAEGQQKIADGETKLTEAKQEIADAEAEIQKIENPKWYVQNRDEALEEYEGYGENADRMRSIGKVFPVVFFLVAALISLTTMTRMVEEERVQIGTLKALGYSKGKIAKKYIYYALLATLGGSIFGFMVGEKVLPFIIIYAYKILYTHIPDIAVPYHFGYAASATLMAVFCTLLATVLSCYKELQSEPAVLMRPPSPKGGKRILLERVGWFWGRLSFIWKSSIRNLIRYKKRFFMTIFGIGGCMALMLVGFGLKDCIYEIVSLQYEKIQFYDASVYLDDDISGEEQKEILDQLDSDSAVEAHMQVKMQKIKVKSDSDEESLYLTVPQQDDMDEFVSFHSRTSDDVYSLEKNQVIITEKISQLLDVKVGDKLTILDEDKGEKEVTIGAICENYMGHYLYISPEMYESVYGAPAEYNSIFYLVKDGQEAKIEEVGSELLKYDDVLNVSYMSSIEDRLDDMLRSLNLVIVVLIVSAGMLAFVVLYNLNNINITERKRELATIKVLGFYDNEVASYVYRENIMLTLIGALAGIGLGQFLLRFVIVTVEVNEAMFGREIHGMSYVYSLLFTVGFSLFVNWVMYFKLKKIDMVESLKSVE